MSLFCWYDQQEGPGGPEGERGISSELLNARRDVSRAIANHLLRTRSESERRQAEREAVENAQRIWNDPENQGFRDWINPPEPRF